ncbi:MAG: SOS response-associated peptidase [Cyclobacteriaceae bacterium]
MCGRYTVQIDMVALHERFKVALNEMYAKSSNCAPTEELPVITNKQPEELKLFRWGLVPFWAKDLKIGFKMINARADTILEKKSFSLPLQKRRCLVLADSFYEWKKLDKKNKQPYRIMLKSAQPFTFAGIWEYNGVLNVNTYSIITTDANELVNEVHDRMPVILKPEDEQKWLSDSLDLKEAVDMLRPFPAEKMKMYQVNPAVGNARNKDPELTQPWHGA